MNLGILQMLSIRWFSHFVTYSIQLIPNLKRLSSDLNVSATKLYDIARELSTIVEETSSAYEEMSSSFESNLNAIKQQADSMDIIKNDIEGIDISSNQISQRISRLSTSIEIAVKQSEEGEVTITKSISAIESIAEYLKEVEQTIVNINEIADKINLLALMLQSKQHVQVNRVRDSPLLLTRLTNWQIKPPI